MALGIVVWPTSKGSSDGMPLIMLPNVVFDVPKSSPHADIAVSKRSVRLQPSGTAIQRFHASSMSRNAYGGQVPTVANAGRSGCGASAALVQIAVAIAWF